MNQNIPLRLLFAGGGHAVMKRPMGDGLKSWKKSRFVPLTELSSKLTAELAGQANVAML